MSWFKFNWFNSDEKKELERLRKENEYLQNDNQVLRASKIISRTTSTEQPYKSLYFSNGSVTVILRDGTVISKDGISKETFDQIMNATSIPEIDKLMTEVPDVTSSNRQVTIETREERDLVSKNLKVLEGRADFTINGNIVRMTGVSLAIPATVLASFIEILDRLELVYQQDDFDEDREGELLDEFQALKMFWLKLALNGIESSRNDLLNFVRVNDVKITTNGNLVLYRRVVSKGDKNKQLITFISQEYYKVKKWKKSPKNYHVYKQILEEDEEGTPTKVEFKLSQYEEEGLEYIGGLQDLYLDLPNMEDNIFTAWHGRNTEIKIGAIYKIPESKINLDNGICAAGGLHAAAVDYDYSAFGDIPVVVLVSPSKAITVPVNETGKLRTTEMFIACVNDKPHGEHYDSESLVAFDEEYNNLSIQELEEAVANKSFAPASVVDEVSPITFLDLENIKNMLKERINHI